MLDELYKNATCDAVVRLVVISGFLATIITFFLNSFQNDGYINMNIKL